MAITITKESIKELQFNDLVAWCKENNKIDWLKALPRTKTVKVYPTKDKVGKDGKVRQVYDKSKAPIGEKTINTPYTTIKAAFISEFFPQFKADDTKEPTMWDIIDTL